VKWQQGSPGGDKNRNFNAEAAKDAERKTQRGKEFKKGAEGKRFAFIGWNHLIAMTLSLLTRYAGIKVSVN
jgi:hypothetical protein